MSIGPLINLADGYIQSLFSTPSSGTSQAGTASTGTSTSGGTQDTNQLSPFAQVLSSLQQLQQSNPTQYQQVTQQISANLQTAAQTATANGNTSLANELNKLSADFSSASTSGQLPNVQDPAQAIGGGHHHFHHGGQSLSPSQTGPTANNSLNPLSIIDSTLSSAGVQVS
jgi:hypothetical protein